MVISLIGYRGSGKTSVARALAERLNWNWVDSDDEVERRADQTIQQIFETDGEETFRLYEREVMVKLLQRDKTVIATGGGVVLDPDTRRDLRSAGPVVWLSAPVNLLMERIAADPDSAERRPALTDHDAQVEVAVVLQQREPFYRECASLIVETGHAPVETLADWIINSLGESLSSDK